MKIFCINNNPQGRGTYWRCFWLGQSLVKQGHKVIIFCLQRKKSLKITTQTITGLKVVALPRFANSGLKELPGHLFRAIYIFFKTVFNKVDVFHTFNVASLTCGLPVFPLWLIKRLGLKEFKIIVDWDDLWGKEGLTHLNKQGTITENIAEFLETKIPLLADKVTTVSDELKKRAINAGVKPKNIIKIINGSAIDTIKQTSIKEARKKLSISQKELIVCFAGTITINLKMVLAAFEEVERQVRGARLALIIPLKSKEQDLISKSGISDKIDKVGFLPYEKYLLYLAASDIVLLPRSGHILDRVEFPSRLGDAMALGRPILTNCSGDAWKLVEENRAGLVAKVNDAQDFARKMAKLLTDSDLRKEMSKNTRLAAEKKYSCDKLANKLLKEVYEKS